MSKRIRLQWDRNQDVETEYYRVYRSINPNLTGEDKSQLIMRVEHPKHKNPIKVENEVLHRIDDITYEIAHHTIMVEHGGETFPFILSVDGIETTNFSLDVEDGLVVLDNPVDDHIEVKLKEYTFDGMEVWDYELDEQEKTYYGPEAKDTSMPKPPNTVTMSRESSNNRVVIHWSDATLVGKVFYYRIDSAIDENKYSRLSAMKNATLREPLADRPYIVERSDNGVRWTQVAKIAGNKFYEYMSDRNPPDPIENLSSDFFLYRGLGKAQIVLEWQQIFNTATSKTALYRIRGMNRVGIVSEPSQVVGPIEFKIDISHILIRRKIDDGVPPSFDGTDATTLVQINDLSKTKFIETVEDNTDYMYGMWVVDTAGNHSSIAYTIVSIPDATAPSLEMNLTGEQFHTIVG